MKPNVAILGSTGMLGSLTLDLFARGDDFSVLTTYRDADAAAAMRADYPSVEFRELDVETADVAKLSRTLDGVDWIVNAIGIIKPYIRDDNAEEVERATRVNGLFPHLLSKTAEQTGSRVIQIATDCVYSGSTGNYVETDAHDALDVYGKTKSLGEVNSDTMRHIRCSIIGPEVKSHFSLMDWFRGQPTGAEVNGFSDHLWNGVTTLHFAKICRGIIQAAIDLPHVQHVLPGNTLTKADLLKSFAKEFGRDDVRINVIEAPTVIDRTLATNDEEANRKIWDAAGYETPPAIEQMVAEISEYALSGSLASSGRPRE